MRVLVSLPSGARHEEMLTVEPDWSSQDLCEAIENAAQQRLGHRVAALMSYRDGRRVPLTPRQTIASLGLQGPDACVRCELTSAPRVKRCEPPFGPVAGGTLVTIRGSGFLAQSGFGSSSSTSGGARVSFGAGCTVPCWRASDEELLCRAPPHDAATVSVTLLGCENSESSGAAACEFASEGRMCDLIFATTNAHCPLRRAGEDVHEAGAAGAARDRRDGE